MKIFSLLETKYYQMESVVRNFLSQTLSKYNIIYGNNTVFGQLIQVLNAVSQNMMLYIEDAMVEQNKYTAQRKKSIYGLAALSGYNPSLGKAASVQLALTYIPNNSTGLNVVLNNKTPLTCTQNGLIYNLILPQESIVLNIEDNVTRYINAVQGKFETQTFVSTGGEYYTQNIKFLGNLDEDYIEVKVNNVIWEKKDSLYDMNANGQEWTYKVSPVGGIDLIFGNGTYGRPLKSDDVIEVTYLTHDGEAGNLDTKLETYFVFENSLKDISGEEIDGNSVFNITFSIEDSVSSGTNSEHIDQVRRMIGLNSRSLVLASPENYKNLLNKFSFCGYNRTWSERGSLVINSIVMRNYKLLMANGQDYFKLKENDLVLTPAQKSSIVNYIENSGRQLAGITYNIFDPEIRKYALFIYVTLKNPNANKEYITSKIKDIVGNFFAEIPSDIFIPKSDIVYVIKNEINEIDGVDVYFLSEANESALNNKFYINKIYKYDSSKGVYKISTEKVYLFDNENPGLGLDEHGNIYLDSDEQFPAIMGGWSYVNQNGDVVNVIDPVTIVYK